MLRRHYGFFFALSLLLTFGATQLGCEVIDSEGSEPSNTIDSNDGGVSRDASESGSDSAQGAGDSDLDTTAGSDSADDVSPDDLGSDLQGLDPDDLASHALVDAINDYRESLQLSPIPFSPALTIVAQTHVADLTLNDPVGGECNLHSWSDQGSWSGCCYTSDHARASCMWDKPRELTDYTDNGFEISAFGFDLTAEDALALWQSSPGHHDVIINADIWADQPWNAIGAANSGDYAVVWFGNSIDPTAD